MKLPSIPSDLFTNISIKPPSFSSDDLLNVSLNSATGQAILLVAFIFFMLALIGLSRRYLISSSIKGMGAGIISGFIIMLILQGAFIWGVNSINTDEDINYLPPVVKTILSGGKDNLTQVLGVSSQRDMPTAQSVVANFDDLPELDAKLVTDSICKSTDSLGTGRKTTEIE